MFSNINFDEESCVVDMVTVDAKTCCVNEVPDNMIENEQQVNRIGATSYIPTQNYCFYEPLKPIQHVQTFQPNQSFQVIQPVQISHSLQDIHPSQSFCQTKTTRENAIQCNKKNNKKKRDKKSSKNKKKDKKKDKKCSSEEYSKNHNEELEIDEDVCESINMSEEENRSCEINHGINNHGINNHGINNYKDNVYITDEEGEEDEVSDLEEEKSDKELIRTNDTYKKIREKSITKNKEKKKEEKTSWKNIWRDTSNVLADVPTYDGTYVPTDNPNDNTKRSIESNTKNNKRNIRENIRNRTIEKTKEDDREKSRNNREKEKNNFSHTCNYCYTAFPTHSNNKIDKTNTYNDISLLDDPFLY
jgi:hypothetical protein